MARPRSVEELQSLVKAPVLLPDSPTYDNVRRVWNGMIDRRPAIIIRCSNTAEVSSAIRYARGNDLRITARGGGHNVAGLAVADGAVLIDLSMMRDVEVDLDGMTATASGGCLLRDLDEATAPHQLACPNGVVSDTGLGGLALGGGYGWLARKWGLTCDHLVGAELVMMDGSVRYVDDDSDPELMWALRGGGGSSLAIVSRFRFALRPISEVYFREWVYSADQITDALASYRSMAGTQPDSLHTVVALKPGTGDDGPELFVRAIWIGDPNDGRRATASFAERVPTARAAEDVRSYLDLQRMGDDSEPAGRRYFTKSCYLTDAPAEVAAIMADAARSSPSPRSSIDFEYLMGAIARPSVESGFPHRDAPFMCTASAHWVDMADDAPNIAWARQTIERLGSWRHGSAYANYVQDPLDAIALYGEQRVERLTDLKRRFDSENVLVGSQVLSTRMEPQ